jgi:hypothetical protein
VNHENGGTSSNGGLVITGGGFSSVINSNSAVDKGYKHTKNKLQCDKYMIKKSPGPTEFNNFFASNDNKEMLHGTIPNIDERKH